MKGAARLFFILAIIYAICGLALGLQMGASQDHGQMTTHAHIMEAGWVMSAVFAYFYHLFPAIGAKAMAFVHFWVQAVSGVALAVSLYVLTAGHESAEPITAIASTGFFVGMLIFAWNALPVLRTA